MFIHCMLKPLNLSCQQGYLDDKKFYIDTISKYQGEYYTYYIDHALKDLDPF
jgi:hypothetical protein